MCMFASVRTRHIRGGSGCCHKNSIQKQTIVAAAQRHPCFKLLPLRQYVVTVNVCGWCTAGDRTPAAFSQLLIIQNNQTHIVGPHTRYTRRTTTVAKAVAYAYVCSPFSTCDAPGISNQPPPAGEPCTKYHNMLVKGTSKKKETTHYSLPIRSMAGAEPLSSHK